MSLLQPIKKSGVYSIFGKHYGDYLINFITGCCPDIGTLCTSIKHCIGIFPEGNPNLVLNQQGDWVAAGSSNFIITTKANLDSLIASNSIKNNVQYLITNAQASNPECITSTVLVFGTSPNTVSESGIRFQLVADYVNIPMFNDELADFSIGAKCIYGSRVWVNVTGHLGSSIGAFPMDLLMMNSDWEPAPYEEGVNYSLVQIDCKYDIVNDFIFSQKYKGLEIGTELVYVQEFGFSSVDYCDWGQVNIATIIEVRGLMFLNNSNLQQAINVFAPLIINNLCEILQQISISISKMTSFEALPEQVIAYNECRSIRAISNTQSIIGIPSTVSDYSFVTDDENGYIEYNFNDSPLSTGDTVVIGCIANKGVCTTRFEVGSDGNFVENSDINIAIDVDDSSVCNVNTLGQINIKTTVVNQVSNRTTDYNRLLKMSVSSNVTSGKLYIAYKYV